ncbi:hypothetical protein N9189_02180 [Pirellulaceae bacterium]|nr:hypothetical protein [Pirellulaceae bacterium]
MNRDLQLKDPRRSSGRAKIRIVASNDLGGFKAFNQTRRKRRWLLGSKNVGT